MVLRVPVQVPVSQRWLPCPHCAQNKNSGSTNVQCNTTWICFRKCRPETQTKHVHQESVDKLNRTAVERCELLARYITTFVRFTKEKVRT